jgi:hypothetical protein
MPQSLGLNNSLRAKKIRPQNPNKAWETARNRWRAYLRPNSENSNLIADAASTLRCYAPSAWIDRCFALSAAIEIGGCSRSLESVQVGLGQCMAMMHLSLKCGNRQFPDSFSMLSITRILSGAFCLASFKPSSFSSPTGTGGRPISSEDSEMFSDDKTVLCFGNDFSG